MIVTITGWGLATPLGLNAPETWENLLAGRHIVDHARVPIHPIPGRARVSQLASIAAREAISQCGWSNEILRADHTALLIGTSKGPVEEWLTPSQGNTAAIEAGTNEFAAYGLSQIAATLAADLQLGFGPRLTLSAACASGLHALIRATLMLQSGEAKRALVVAVESSLHPLFIGCFQRLGVLPKPGVGCRPFDRQRDGFLMSESAAAICLEAVDDPMSCPAKLRIEQFAFGGAAGHLTAGDADGAVLQHLLHRVLDGRPLDLIHAHGTGTRVNDPIELAALETVLDWRAAVPFRRGGRGQPPSKIHSRGRPVLDRPILYSHKGALGHSLGAAGLVAIVLNCLMHSHGQIPPNVMTTDPLPTNQLLLSNEAIAHPIHRSLVTASGFGGPTAVVSLVTI